MQLVYAYPSSTHTQTRLMGSLEIALVMPFNKTLCFTCSSPLYSTSHLSFLCFHSISTLSLPVFNRRLKVMWVCQKARWPPTSVWMFCLGVYFERNTKHSCCCGLLGSSMFSACKHTQHFGESPVWRPIAKHIKLPLFPTAKARQNTVKGAFICFCLIYLTLMFFLGSEVL